MGIYTGALDWLSYFGPPADPPAVCQCAVCGDDMYEGDAAYPSGDGLMCEYCKNDTKVYI